jgi:hypothetical protein
MSDTTDTKARQEELMEDLSETITNIVHYYNGILDEMKAGKYTPQKAYQDHQHLMFNEGNDLMFILESLGEME